MQKTDESRAPISRDPERKKELKAENVENTKTNEATKWKTEEKRRQQKSKQTNKNESKKNEQKLLQEKNQAHVYTG